MKKIVFGIWGLALFIGGLTRIANMFSLELSLSIAAMILGAVWFSEIINE